MANNQSLVSLKLDSGNYESNIKRAQQALNAMERECRKVAGTFEVVEKDQLAYVRALGQMETKSSTTKGALRELTQTLTDATAIYRRLTDAEKNSEFGRKLNASILQLSQRAGDLRDVMADVNEQIGHLSSDTQLTDSINAVTGVIRSAALAVTVFAGDSKDLKTVLMDLAKIQTLVNVVQNLTKAFQAQNLVLMKNPYVLAAAGVATLVLAMKNLNSETEAEIKAAQRAKEAYEKKKQAMSSAMNKYAETIAQMRMLIITAKDENRSIKERNDACKELNQIVPTANANIDKTTNAFNANASAIANATSQLETYYKMLAAQDYLKELYTEQIKYKVGLEQMESWLANRTRIYDREHQKVNDAVDKQNQGGGAGVYVGGPDMHGGYQIGQRNSVASVDRSAEQAAARGMAAAQRGVNHATTMLTELNQKIAITERSLADLTRQNGGFRPNTPTVNTSGGGGATDKTKAAFKLTAPDTYFSITDLMGARGVSINEMRYYLKEVMDEINSTDDPMMRWQLQLDAAELEKQIKAMEKGPLDIDLKLPTGTTNKKKSKKEQMAESLKDSNWADISGNILGELGSIVGNLENMGITIPEGIKNTIGIMQSVLGVITGIATIVGTIQAIQTAQLARNMIPFLHTGGLVHAANGVFVPGALNGGRDTVPAMLSPGELVLNRAQQSSLASQLQGSGMGAMHLETEIKGENLRVVLRNNDRRRGRGEYLTSKSR